MVVGAFKKSNNHNKKKLRLNNNIIEIIWGETTECNNELSHITNRSNMSDDENDTKSKRIIGFFLGYSIYLGEGGFDGEGIGRFVIRLIDGLLSNDKEVTIVVMTSSENYSIIDKAFKRYIPNYPSRLLIRPFSNVEWVNKNIHVDVWVVPYIGMESALQLNKPIIVCLHDLVYMHFEDMYKCQSGFNNECTFIVNRLVNKATKVVFNSNFIRNNEGFKFLKLPYEKTQVIRLAAPKQEYNSIDLCNEDGFRNKYKLYNNYIVYPSVIRLHKNHDRLIEAFLKFKRTNKGAISNLNLVLTDNYKNRPKEQEIKAVLNKCMNINIQNSVIFLGRLPSNDIPLLYKYALGTIIPTLFEGSCPFQILESLTMNTPVAMSKIKVVKEVITDVDKFITFNPYSIEEIERAIEDLWEINDLEIQEQKKAIEKVMKRTWSDVAREYQTLINQIVK